HPLELANIARVNRLQLHPQRRCRGLHGGELANAGDRRLTQYRHALHAWRDLLEQLQPLGANAVLEHSKAGGLAAVPGDGADKAVCVLLAGGVVHHDCCACFTQALSDRRTDALRRAGYYRHLGPSNCSLELLWSPLQYPSWNVSKYEQRQVPQGSKTGSPCFGLAGCPVAGAAASAAEVLPMTPDDRNGEPGAEVPSWRNIEMLPSEGLAFK